MKKIIKVTALAGMSTLLAANTLPVQAEDASSDTTKDESVYVVLDTDGSVSSITVSDQLHNDSGFKNYEDTSSLENIQNLNSTEAVTTSSDGVVWNTDETDIYYQGTTEKALPLDIQITYTLNGKEVDPEDILGESGHLKLTITVTNTEVQEYTVNGITYKACKPFYVATGGLFDETHFSDVTINHGAVSDDNAHKLAIGVMLPGMKDTLDTLLTGNLSEFSDYLYDEIEIEADVTDFASPTLMLGASSDLNVLKEALDGDSSFSTDDLFSQLDELQEATNQLMDGASALYDGASTLASGATELNDGASTLLDGVISLHNGTTSLLSGANQLNTGIGTLQGGLSQLVTNNSTLNQGASSIADGILSTVNRSLSESGLETVTWENYADKFAEYLNVTDSMRQSAINQIISSVESATGVTLTSDQVKLALYLCYTNCTDQSSFNSDYVTANIASALQQMNEAATVQAKVSQYSDTEVIAQTNAAISNQLFNDLLSKIEAYGVDEDTAKIALTYTVLSNGELSLDTLETSLSATLLAMQNGSIDPTVYSQASDSATQESVFAGIRESLLNQTISTITQTTGDNATSQMIMAYAVNEYGSLTEGIAKVSADISAAQIVANAQNAIATSEGQQVIIAILNAMVKSSDSYDSLSTGLTTLTQVQAFVIGLQSYTDGVSQLYAGSQTLSSGMQSLVDGASALEQGASQLQSGTQSLKDGTDELSSGADELRDGAKALMDGLEQYNDEGISQLTQNSDLDHLQTVSDLLNEVSEDTYDNYSGISEGTNGSVKFIYKVSGVKDEESSEEVSETDTEESTTFLERLANLFIFWN